MIVTILSFIFVLGVLVFIHELGHFIMAKLVGIRVERFSLGFPPRMIGKKIGETDYCLSWIPIGGYVKLSGMIDESMDKDSIKGEPWEFMSKPAYQRFLVIFAGPMMNLLLAIFIFAIITYVSGVSEPIGTVVSTVPPNSYAERLGFKNGDMITRIDDQAVITWGDVTKAVKEKEQVSVSWKRGDEIYTRVMNTSFIDSIEKTLPPMIGEVVKNFPADAIGLTPGDRVIKINEQSIETWKELTEIIHKTAGQEITIEWERAGELYSAKTIPVKDQTDGYGKIGIAVLSQKKDVGLFHSFYSGIMVSVNLTKMVYKSLKLITTGKESFKNAFGGPIVIAKMAGESARSGAESLFVFMSFLSLNLGLLNLLPIPVLDGGHLLFLAIEAVVRKPIPNKTKLVIQQVGMALLLAFMVFVIINDIRRIL